MYNILSPIPIIASNYYYYFMAILLYIMYNIHYYPPLQISATAEARQLVYNDR